MRIQKLVAACLIFVLFTILQTQAFAFETLSCTFNSDTRINGITSIHITKDFMIINQVKSIPLQHTRIKCGKFGKQHRFDGMENGLHIVLKTCTDEAAMSGYVIDSLNAVAAQIICN